MLTRIAAWAVAVSLLVLLSATCLAIADGWYVILSKESGKCAEVQGWGKNNEANVAQYAYHGGANQQWRFDSLGGDQYAIINRNSGLCLEVAMWKDKNRCDHLDGANVRQWQYVGGENQKWRLEPAGHEYYRIVSVYSGKSLDVVSEYSHDDGANIQQWAGHKKMNQVWLVKPYVDCTWDGAEIRPLLISGHWTDKIDIVFVPDVVYSGHLADFQDDVWEVIRDGYLRLDEYCDEPIPADYLDRFNFYFYWSSTFADWVSGCSWWLPGQQAFSQWVNCVKSLCTIPGTPCPCPNKPSWFGSQAPWADVSAIFSPSDNCAIGCASLGPPGTFAAPGNSNISNAGLLPPGDGINTMVHESGHALFGLMDEYCGCTSYDHDHEANIWDSKKECEDAANAQGWSNGSCREITCSRNCGKGTVTITGGWRYDADTPNPDFMTACGSGCTATYRFHEADARRINYVFETWPWTPFFDAIAGFFTSGVASTFAISEDGITHVCSEVVDGFPNQGSLQGPYRLVAKSWADQIIGSFYFQDPRIRFPPYGERYEIPSGSEVFQLIYPLFEGMASISILDAVTGETLLDVDISDVLY